MADTIQIRRGTTSAWNSANPVLALGEQGYDTTTKQYKVGDGTTAWTALAYSTPGHIAANTVLANPSGVLANPVGVDAAGMRTLLSAVGYVSQTLTTAQKQQVIDNIGLNEAPPVVILFHGDSNMHGMPLDTSAQAWEILSRSDLKILNNSTLVFQDLDIGSNNDASSVGRHGAELQLANCCRLGDLNGTIYCVKVAVSGSRIAEWSVGNATGYWTNFLARIAAIESQLGTINIRWVVWNSSGINEARDNMTAANYKSAVIAHFAKLRNRLGATTPILHLNIPTGFAEYNATYATKITEIASEYADTYAISITNIAVEADNIHYTYQGLKNLTERLVDKTQDVLGYRPQQKKAVTFSQLISATVDGQGIRSSGAATSGGISNRAFSNDINWSVVANFEGGTGSPVLVAIDGLESDNLIWNDHNYVASFVWVSGLAYYGSASAYITAATGFTFPSKVKFEKSGNDITISSTTDGGLTWTVRHTLTGALTGKTALWIKAVFQGSSVGNRVKVNLYQ